MSLASQLVPASDGVATFMDFLLDDGSESDASLVTPTWSDWSDSEPSDFDDALSPDSDAEY